MEPGAAAAAGPGELLQALLEGAGGRGRVLLVAELWEREQSRSLMRDFARHVFPEPREGAEEEAAAARAPGRGPPERAICSPLVFVLCREASLRAPEPRLRLREILRDVRARRRRRPPARGRSGHCGAALVGVLVQEPGGGRGETRGAGRASGAEAAHLLEALLRSVFGRDAGGPVQAACYCPARPGSAADVQDAACRALRAAAGQRPPERMHERLGFQRLLRCLPWSSWSRRKGRADSPTSSPEEDGFQDPSEELALTVLSPNGHCEDIEGRIGA
ncbi:uncharacterized protein C2orf72 homolog isoform X2 [Sarcophilus harrisii]|uniref:uncharacterized protein C2orf72 homolog isoform X2 n=1 Tax=Sarcophilus harrisii TaxID=9305 RepID=UPI001301A5E0|nr:uncharacterized protein C2orf72 homolog isoform X2 [Sarcophilus harrisii]